MALAKITLTLEQDEQQGTNAAMDETIKLIAGEEGLPLQKLAITLECEEIIAERYRERLRATLKKRPMGINIKMTTKTEESVAREWVKPSTPMEKVWGDDEESVTLSHNGRSVTLTAETARNASEMLRRSGGDDDHS